MTALTLCLLATLVGGVLSAGVALLTTASISRSTLSRLVSYATGALLAAAFFNVLPEAIHESGNAQETTSLVLAGIVTFFLLEKLVIWRHDHGQAASDASVVHGHHHTRGDVEVGRGGLLMMLGDTFHNFVDGILVAAAFQQDVALGLVTSVAIVAHEIPQELGDFVVLLHSGVSRRRALVFNLLSSLAMTLGAALAWLALPLMDGAVPVSLALACASMTYVAMADLIPSLHRHPSLGATMEQLVLMGAGMVSVAGAHELLELVGVH